MNVMAIHPVTVEIIQLGPKLNCSPTVDVLKFQRVFKEASGCQICGTLKPLCYGAYPTLNFKGFAFWLPAKVVIYFDAKKTKQKQMPQYLSEIREMNYDNNKC